MTLMLRRRLPLVLTTLLLLVVVGSAAHADSVQFFSATGDGLGDSLTVVVEGKVRDGAPVAAISLVGTHDGMPVTAEKDLTGDELRAFIEGPMAQAMRSWRANQTWIPSPPTSPVIVWTRARWGPVPRCLGFAMATSDNQSLILQIQGSDVLEFADSLDTAQRWIEEAARQESVEEVATNPTPQPSALATSSPSPSHPAGQTPPEQKAEVPELSHLPANAAVLVVSDSTDSDLNHKENDVVAAVAQIRTAAGLGKGRLPVLVYHVNHPQEERYCQSTLHLTRKDVLFVGVAKCHGLVPVGILAGQREVSDVKQALLASIQEADDRAEVAAMVRENGGLVDAVQVEGGWALVTYADSAPSDRHFRLETQEIFKKVDGRWTSMANDGVRLDYDLKRSCWVPSGSAYAWMSHNGVPRGLQKGLLSLPPGFSPRGLTGE